MAAINQAVLEIVEREETPECRSELLHVKCLVLGPGLGRLIKFCVDAARQQGTSVAVHALEANPVAVEFLNKEFADSLGKEVFIHDPFVFHPSVTKDTLPKDIKAHCKTFDIVVSELLGCFGDDEFLPELTSSLAKYFLKPNLGIMIPQSWTNFIVPVSSHMTQDFLRTLKRPSDAGYVMGLPEDCMFLSETTTVWSGYCCELADKYSADIEFDISLNSTQLLNSKAKENRNKCTCTCMMHCQKTKASEGGVKTEINGDADEGRSVQSVERKDISCCKAHNSRQSFAQCSCCVKTENNAQDTLTSIQGSQTSMQDQQTSTQNITALGHTDTCPEQTVQVENQPHHATSQTSLSERATDNHGVGKTANSTTFECNSKAVYCKCHFHVQSTHKQKLDKSGVKESEVFVHGFVGYFTAVLYGDIMIDTRHTSLGRNSFHWECFFFPVREPVRMSTLPSDPSHVTSSIRLHLERKCKQLSDWDHTLKLWYEWQVTVRDCVCDVCKSSEGNRIQDKPVPLNFEYGKTGSEWEQFYNGEMPTSKALNEPCNSNSAATQSSVERVEHKYPLQNAEGHCDAVFLQCHQLSKTDCDNTIDVECLSFETKPKKQKQHDSNWTSTLEKHR